MPGINGNGTKFRTQLCFNVLKKWFPSKRTLHRFPMKLGLVVVTGQGDIKSVVKRWGHRACFHTTMLTNTVI